MLNRQLPPTQEEVCEASTGRVGGRPLPHKQLRTLAVPGMLPYRDAATESAVYDKFYKGESAPLHMPTVSKFVLLGDTSSGKTVYLTMLSQAFTRSNWTLTADEDASEQLAEWRADMIDGRFPSPTTTDLEKDDLTVLTLTFTNGDTIVTIRVPDVGGMMTNPDKGRGFYKTHVENADGVLILVDSTLSSQKHGAYLKFFQSVCMRLTLIAIQRQQNPLQWVDRPILHVPICFTKCDEQAVIDPDSFMQEFPTESQLEMTVGTPAFQHIQSMRRHSRIKSELFACSAVGFQTTRVAGTPPRRKPLPAPNGPYCVSQVRKEGDNASIVDGVNIFPVNVEAPLVWLLDSIYEPQQKGWWKWFPRRDAAR